MITSVEPVGDTRRRAARAGHLLAAALALVSCGAGSSVARPPEGEVRGAASGIARAPDVPYEPTPPEVVRAMLDLGGVQAGDVVYDLGCGDGRIVVEAAKRGARGVGVDIDPERIREARENVRAAKVEDRVELVEGDLFDTDVRPATAVMLYLWPHVNLRLRPKLLAELRPGTRVVSHSHDMGDWKPDRTIRVGRAQLFLWTIPEPAASGR